MLPENQPAAAAATAIDIDGAFAGQMQQAKPDSDPRVVRWGYNPGLRGLTLNPRETGIREAFVPVGKFFAHTTFQTPRENCTLDEYKEKEYLVDVTAADSEETARVALGVWGYQSFFYGEVDIVKVAAINQVLIPTLQEIRLLFDEDSPIEAKCKGEDEMDLGVGRSHCATCHLQWITSEACDLLISEAVANGRAVVVREQDGTLSERKVKLNLDMVTAARRHVQAGLETYIQKASKDWSTTISEIENKKRDQIQDAEHFLRKDLHQIKPQNMAIEMVERVSQATTGASSDVLASLARSQAMLAESQAATNKLLGEVVKQFNKTGTKAAPEQKSAAPEKTEKETK